MSLWKIKGNGFLPSADPIKRLYLPDASQIENLAFNLPKSVANHTVRHDLCNDLSQIKDINDFLDAISTPEQAERAMMLFSYFASSFIHAPGEPKVYVLPKEIAVPLTKLGQMVSRPPILSYASYCLYNWERIDPSKPIELENIKLLQNFTLSDGRRDENWFILIHVDIEAKAAFAVDAIQQMLTCKEEEVIGEILTDLYNAMTGMYETLCRMEEECSTDVYFSKVRPYIFSYENIIFEGVGAEPLTYRGETGAQSSCIPAIQTALGIKHKDSMLTVHLKDMRNYMPVTHRNWLSELEQDRNFRMWAVKLNLKDEYNKCVERLFDFRNKHLEYAVNYIQKKVADPKGTGGTPYIKWLSDLVNETKEFYL
jgi:indoleamine 2,3-dioxygenase